jgi:hypothetical protein
MVNRQLSIGIERRRFLRLPASVSIKFRRISAGYITSRQKLTKDISIRGVRFLSDGFIPVSSYIKVSLSFEENLKPLEFICQVMWVKSLYNDESYEIGAQILEIDKENYKKIKSYIYR